MPQFQQNTFNGGQNQNSGFNPQQNTFGGQKQNNGYNSQQNTFGGQNHRNKSKKQEPAPTYFNAEGFEIYQKSGMIKPNQNEAWGKRATEILKEIDAQIRNLYHNVLTTDNGAFKLNAEGQNVAVDIKNQAIRFCFQNQPDQVILKLVNDGLNYIENNLNTLTEPKEQKQYNSRDNSRDNSQAKNQNYGQRNSYHQNQNHNNGGGYHRKNRPA